MAQPLTALFIYLFSEAPAYKGQLTTVYDSSSRGSDALPRPPKAAGTCVV